MNVITLDAAPTAQPFDYFVIKPQKKRQAQQQNFLKNLKKGDEVVTIGGMCGKIFDIEGAKVILEVDDHGRKLTFYKNAISVDNINKQN